nr:MAG TPA: hypothetical protein [Caudoviricetes sp.]
MTALQYTGDITDGKVLQKEDFTGKRHGKRIARIVQSVCSAVVVPSVTEICGGKNGTGDGKNTGKRPKRIFRQKFVG